MQDTQDCALLSYPGGDRHPLYFLQEPAILSFLSETIVATSDIEKGNLMFSQSSEIIKTISLMSLL